MINFWHDNCVWNIFQNSIVIIYLIIFVPVLY